MWSSGLETRPGPFIDVDEPADRGGALDEMTGGDWVMVGGMAGLNDERGEVLETDGEGTDVALIGGRGGRARDGLDGVSRNTVRGSRRGFVVSVGLVNALRVWMRWRSGWGGGCGGAMPYGDGLLPGVGTLGSGPRVRRGRVDGFGPVLDMPPPSAKSPSDIDDEDDGTEIGAEPCMAGGD